MATELKKYITLEVPEGDDSYAIDALLESTNIAEQINEQDRDELAKIAIEGYLADERSRASWVERSEEWIKLAAMLMETKSYPWPNAANVKYPLLTQAVISFQARLYPALVNGVKVVKARVNGADPTGEHQKSAVRVERHMSYQVLEEMEEWEEEMDRLTIVLPILGSAFKKTYFNVSLNRNASEFVHPKDLCVNYWAKSIDTATRVTHIIEMSSNDVHERMHDGRFLDVELATPTVEQLQKRHQTTDRINNLTLINEPDPSYIPRVILEQHTLVDLDGDGYKEPYIFTLDLISRKLLRIVARYESDAITRDDKGAVVSIKPTQYFTKYSFVPNTDGGFYDMGFGLLLGSLNEAANTLINQLLDAGSLSNLQSGFLARGVRLKGGRKGFAPGEWKVVNASGEDLSKGVFPLPVREPSQVLYTLLGTLLDSGQKLSQTVDILVGENPGQNQAATTTLAVIEQGLKVFNAIYKRSHRALKSEFKKLHRLNGLYLDPQVYFTALDDPSLEAIVVYQADYRSGMVNVIPYSDPNVSSEQQRLAKAAALLEMRSQGIELNDEEIRRRLLEAQDQPNIEALERPNPATKSIEELELELEQTKHNHQVELDDANLKLEQQKVDSKSKVDETTALLNVVKAQAEKTNTKLAEIAQLLATLQHIGVGGEKKEDGESTKSGESA